MNLLVPLGLLGLISIAVLILIYILKPNFQQKIISSTYIWKLSLKYRKKRVPISRLTNILIFICQVLILTAATLILTQPIVEGKQAIQNEKVFIIDASASMMMEVGQETRFERAVSMVKTEIQKTFEEGGVVSVILANEESYPIAQRSTPADEAVIHTKLDGLVGEESACSYGSADLTKAVEYAQNVVSQNADAQVYLYTATTYVNKNNINVVDVSHDNDWNVAILGVNALIGDDNYYEISIDVGCYGRSESIAVYCEVFGINGNPNASETLESDEEFFSVAEEEKKIVFTTQDQIDQIGAAIYSFEYLSVHVEETDSFAEDNTFYLYGGTKEKIKVQYASSYPNNFFISSFYTMREVFKNTWDIKFDQVTIDPYEEELNYALEGYDFYIFEHTMPKNIPTDGVVLLVDPDVEPKNSGLRFGRREAADGILTSNVQHPLLSHVVTERIYITKYTKIMAHDGFEELMFYGSNPVLLAKNEADAKVMVMAFDLNYSNFSMLFDFPAFMLNIFNYYMPPTITSFSYEIGDMVSLNAKGETLSVSGGDIESEFTQFPTEIQVTKPGTYTLTQVSMTGDYIVENFFVGISNFESNITKRVDSLPFLYVEKLQEEEWKDLLVWLAAAMLALLFLEWGLHSRKQI